MLIILDVFTHAVPISTSIILTLIFLSTSVIPAAAFFWGRKPATKASADRASTTAAVSALTLNEAGRLLHPQEQGASYVSAAIKSWEEAAKQDAAKAILDWPWVAFLAMQRQDIKSPARA